jgi:hypothetical protein
MFRLMFALMDADSDADVGGPLASLRLLSRDNGRSGLPTRQAKDNPWENAIA